MTSRVGLVLLMLALGVMIVGCVVAEQDQATPTPAPLEERPAARYVAEHDDPQPIVLPDDAAPHDRLTEWWYYTGHLEDEMGYLYGFQFVIFQVIRGEFPPTYAAHFAITDTRDGTFQYAERVDTTPPQNGDAPINLLLRADDGPPWTLTGGAGVDEITASMDGYAFEIRLEDEKPPVLHEGDGYFEFAPGAESYYYSRTRMRASGTLTINNEPLSVTGTAWMDQQWGDFIVLPDIGWDWFSVQLDNGEEVMAWQSHDRVGNVLDSNATIVRTDGTAVDVPGEHLTIEPIETWTSPNTGATYPMGWQITIPNHDIELTIQPVLHDQELITLDSTGVIYWEGMVDIEGSAAGEFVTGLGYVELTGYAPTERP
jgi:predicted secreted hydrolase